MECTIMISYCNIDDVLQLTGVTEDKMGIDEDDDYTLRDILGKWIMFASALIDEYTGNPISETDFIDPEPPRNVQIRKNVYCDVCTRIVANRVALREAYKNYAVIKKDDWTIASVKSDIFTDSEKADLDPYKEEQTTSNTIIGISAVTGRRNICD